MNQHIFNSSTAKYISTLNMTTIQRNKANVYHIKLSNLDYKPFITSIKNVISNIDEQISSLVNKIR